MTRPNRFHITVESDYNAQLIRLWAKAMGKNATSLGAEMLEKGIKHAIKEGDVPAAVLTKLQNDFFSDL